jgi:hypothetical protein
MLNSGTRGDACEALDGDLAESIVLQAYVQLPLLPRQEDGSWVALLKKFAHCDLRLVERVPASSEQGVLRVELFDRRTRSAVKIQHCEAVEDAVAAFLAMVPLAKSYADLSDHGQGPPHQSAW